MKSMIRITGLCILALALGVILAPQVYSLGQQTTSEFQEQAIALVAQLQNYVDAASPNVAAHMAAILLGAGGVAVALFVYLLVFVPIHLYSLQREIRGQGEQIDSLKREIHLSSDLFLEARRGYTAQHENEKEHAEGKSRLRQLIFHGRNEPSMKEQRTRS